MLVRVEVIWVVCISSTLYFFIIVVKCLPCDMLIVASKDAMSQIEVNGSLFEGDWLYITLDLVVIVPITDNSPSKYHFENLFNCSGPLVLEHFIYRERNLRRRYFDRFDLWLYVF